MEKRERGERGRREEEGGVTAESAKDPVETRCERRGKKIDWEIQRKEKGSSFLGGSVGVKSRV